MPSPIAPAAAQGAAVVVCFAIVWDNLTSTTAEQLTATLAESPLKSLKFCDLYGFQTLLTRIVSG